MVSKCITTLTEKKNKRKKRTKKETTVDHSKTHLPSLRVIHILEHSGKKEKTEMK